MSHFSPDHDYAAHQHRAQGHENHSDGHNHAPPDFGARFIIGIGLNVLVVAIEVTFGILGNSVSLIADAGHNLSDALGLGVAYAAHIVGKRGPSPNFSYGLRGTSILAALFNAVFLLVVTGALSWEAIQRFYAPAQVNGPVMTVAAAIGIAVNAGTAALFASGRKGDINIRGAFLHMAGDAMISAGVVAAGLMIILTGQAWIDPLLSLLINGIIIVSTWSLLRESLTMSLAGVPKRIAAADVRHYLAALPGVDSLHDLHIWPISTTETALTAHLVMSQGHPGDQFLLDVAARLHEGFSIGHATLQVEVEKAHLCSLASDDVI